MPNVRLELTTPRSRVYQMSQPGIPKSLSLKCMSLIHPKFVYRNIFLILPFCPAIIFCLLLLYWFLMLCQTQVLMCAEVSYGLPTCLDGVFFYLPMPNQFKYHNIIISPADPINSPFQLILVSFLSGFIANFHFALFSNCIKFMLI